MPAPDVIAAPPAQPPRYGLIAAAAVADDAARWEFGASWEPEGCGVGSKGPYNCAPLAARDDSPNSPGVETAWPVLLYAIDACSAHGSVGRDWIGRARRALAASQSHQLADELWNGTIAAADPGNPTAYLTDLDAVMLESGAAVPVADAIPLLDHAAAQCSQGRRMMLHMPVQVLGVLRETSNYVQREGALLTTDIGSIIVADSGYSGDGPAAAQGSGGQDVGNHWIYSSPVVSIRLGAVETFPRTLDDARELAAVTDRATNDIVAWAQRTALYSLDPCCRFAVQTDVPIPTIPT